MGRPKEDPIPRFWRKVEKLGPKDCWTWTAGRFKRGYGAFAYDGKQPGYAHRFSYELHYGPIPDGMVVMHTCDNRQCVNPRHLRLASQGDNIRDSVAKDRWMTEHRKRHLGKPRQRDRDGRWLPQIPPPLSDRKER